MRIGVYLPNQRADAGGGNTLVEDVTIELLRLKTPHEFVVLGHDAHAPLWLRALGARYETLPLPKRGLPERIRARIRRELDVIRPLDEYQHEIEGFVHGIGLDVVLNTGPWTPVRDVPYVTTVWDLQHRVQPFFPEVSARDEWDRRERSYNAVLPRSARVVVGTERGKQELQLHYAIPDERIVKIPHPTPTFALEARQGDPGPTLTHWGLKPGEYVFYPAQLWPHKNHTTVLEAVALLRSEGLPLRAVFAGSDKGNLAYVRSVASELGVQDSVVFAGFVDRKVLIDLYRGALALTYMSLFGPENLPPLEAFAFGCPVVVARVPGSDEQLGDAALHIPGTDAIALAEALTSLRCDPIRSKLVEAGLARAQSWTATDFAKELISVAAGLEPTLRTWSRRD